MSRVTSAGCCLTPDDTSAAEPANPSATIFINVPRDGARKREGGDRQGGNANKLINRSKERQIAKERPRRSAMSPLIRPTMKWRCLVFMFYHRSRPPEQTRGSSQT